MTENLLGGLALPERRIHNADLVQMERVNNPRILFHLLSYSRIVYTCPCTSMISPLDASPFTLSPTSECIILTPISLSNCACPGVDALPFSHTA